MTPPAIAHGNARNCVVNFIEDSHENLVDIHHYCDDCYEILEHLNISFTTTLEWPAFFSDAQQSVHCENCGQIIHEVENY